MLQLEPIRALTYSRDVKLADVTCPPYDVISSLAADHYQAADPHNIVRLILPRPAGGEDRYVHAARQLQEWLDTGVLERDPDPVLYVYEQTTATGSALGLVGGVSLDGPVLPHENTFPKPVADRAALMSATRAHLEPILLTYEGGGPASDIVDSVVATSPTVETQTDDGALHRVWRISDPSRIATIRTDLADRHALIADGHHRFAAYRQLYSDQSRPGSDAHGLAMLVDATRHPLELRAMHRSVAGLTLDAAVAAAKLGFTITPLASDAQPLAALEGWPDDTSPVFAIGDGDDRWFLLSAPTTRLLADTMPTERSAQWRSLDAAVMRQSLLAGLWDVDDADPTVGYHHEPEQAIARVRSAGGVAVFLRPPALTAVLQLAARGERMPQKSTSFGPKPRTGLVMRHLT